MLENRNSFDITPSCQNILLNINLIFHEEKFCAYTVKHFTSMLLHKLLLIEIEIYILHFCVKLMKHTLNLANSGIGNICLKNVIIITGRHITELITFQLRSLKTYFFDS